MEIAVKLNTFFTFAMFGLIWLVQLVHYPMFAGLGDEHFMNWHGFHSNRISWIVMPIMVGELGVSLYAAWLSPDWRMLSLLSITIAIWISTFTLSVPLHNRLGANAEPRSPTIDRLVVTNWPRTLLYSVKTALILSLTQISF